jgi:hypothetical protein
METTNLQGKRYIGLLRCSSAKQADTSIDDQRRVLEVYAREHGLIPVDYVSLGGVSGSLPGNRTDIRDLIARKEQKNDFDLVLVQDTGRLTRGGVQHAHHIESALNAADIDVVYVKCSIPSGPEGDLIRSVMAYSDQQHARSISFSSTRGSMSSILDNRSAYCRQPPYGIDRLYVSPDGNELHVLRNLPDRTQVKLDPKTGQVIATFGPNETTGVPNHYVKQKQERIVLVPGDEKCVEVVRRIYRRHHVDGWGRYRIAQELNQEGIPSPAGKKWSTDEIARILRNPIYLGRGIANRITSGIYNMRSPNSPLPSNVSRKELYTRKRPVTRVRPQADWHIQEHHRLAEILDPEVRQVAAARQHEYLERLSSGERARPNRDRHTDTTFFLKGLLRSKQGNRSMTGTRSGRGGKYRYYRVHEAYSSPDGNAIMRRMIRAEPIEQIVLETVKAALLSAPDLRERIERQVRSALKESASDQGEREALVAEREAIRKKLKVLVERLDPEMLELIDDDMASLKAQLRSVNDRLSRCEMMPPMDDQAVHRLVDKTIAAIRSLASTLQDAPAATLRQYLQLFITQLVVDMETGRLTIGIGAPAELDAESLEMCLVEGSVCKPFNQTHQIPPAHVATHRLALPVTPCRSRYRSPYPKEIGKAA